MESFNIHVDEAAKILCDGWKRYTKMKKNNAIKPRKNLPRFKGNEFFLVRQYPNPCLVSIPAHTIAQRTTARHRETIFDGLLNRMLEYPPLIDKTKTLQVA